MLPKELKKALQEKSLLSNYHNLPDSRKKRYIYWLESAKKDETKQRRIKKILDEILNV